MIRKKKPVAVPKVEIDLSTIRQLSHKHEDENWEFRSWLKWRAPRNIDSVVKKLSQKYSALIDCTKCGNCCRSLTIEFKRSELYTIATTLGESIEVFQKKFMTEESVNPPCPMLDGNLCSIYDNRPEVCRSFPHLEQPGFVAKLISVIDRVSVCPIAFNTFEELKAKLWRRV